MEIEGITIEYQWTRNGATYFTVKKDDFDFELQISNNMCRIVNCYHGLHCIFDDDFVITRVEEHYNNAMRREHELQFIDKASEKILPYLTPYFLRKMTEVAYLIEISNNNMVIDDLNSVNKELLERVSKLVAGAAPETLVGEAHRE